MKAIICRAKLISTAGPRLWRFPAGRSPAAAAAKFHSALTFCLAPYSKGLWLGFATAAVRLVAGCALTLIPFLGYAQDQLNADKFVSKDEYLKLKADHEQLKQELEAIKALLRQSPAAGVATNAPPDGGVNLNSRVEQLEKKQSQQQAETDQSFDQLDNDLKKIVQKTKAAIPGTTKMLLTGYGSASFQSASAGYGPSQPPDETSLNGSRAAQNNFFATLNAILLWEISPKILFETEIEFETDFGTRTVSPNLEMAQFHYLLTDNLTIEAGAFLDPMDYFIERQHMSWINKLPDRPLAVYDGILPETEVGVQLRGGVPIGATKLEFSLFTAMAPKLSLSSSGGASFGTLNFDDYDVSSHLAVGGHVGFFPIPSLEIGYGFQYFNTAPQDSDTGDSLGNDVSVLLQSADLSYVKDFDSIRGTINFHAQWSWSHFNNFESVVNNLNAQDGLSGSAALSPLANNRDGGYAQIAYRPTKLENNIIRNLEPVFRYDRINQMRTSLGQDEDRYTIGLDYWLGPSTVIKFAYEIDQQHGAANNSYGNFAQNGHAIWFQAAVGF